MIDDYNADGTGWARFSEDRRMRYRLARAITTYGRVWITDWMIFHPFKASR